VATYRYVIADVFTDTPLQGNQLAVFTDARQIPEEQLQRLAKEMNYSETVFVYTPEAGGHARIRIFTPTSELPFAGHPVLGTAFVLGGPLQLPEIKLETGQGVVPVVLERDESGRIVFGRMQQPIPTVEAFGPQDEVFASIVEQRLNVQPPAGAEYVHFEILNFAVPGLSPLGEISLLQKQIAAFSPDIVLLVTHTVDYKWVSRDLHRSLRSRIPIPSDVLRRALKEARITARTHEVLAADRLKPHEPALLYWCYERIVEESRHLGALPVAIFLPLPDQLPKKLSSAVQQTTLIRQSGLILIDFTRLYDNEHPADLMRPEIWRHSTAQAHALIADALYQRLMTDPDIDLGNRARRVSVAAATPSAITQP